MELVLKALDFARARHAGQVRKATNQPYINHPIAVGYIVASFKHSKHHEELLAASFLHDTLEDTNTSLVELAMEFGGLVASIVHELTNDEVAIKEIGKLEYHKKKLVAMSSHALVIKLADRLHNIMDHPSLKMVHDTLELMAHVKKNRRLTNTHRRLVAAIEARAATLMENQLV